MCLYFNLQSGLSKEQIKAKKKKRNQQQQQQQHIYTLYTTYTYKQSKNFCCHCCHHHRKHAASKILIHILCVYVCMYVCMYMCMYLNMFLYKSRSLHPEFTTLQTTTHSINMTHIQTYTYNLKNITKNKYILKQHISFVSKLSQNQNNETKKKTKKKEQQRL